MSSMDPPRGTATPENAGPPTDGTRPNEPGLAPDGQAAKKHRNPWIWISAGLAVVAAGLLIWALSTKSELDGTQQDVAELQAQAEQGQETGSDIVAAFKAAYDELAQQLGATSEDLAATEQDLKDAEDAAAQAQKDATAAKQDAAEAKTETDKASAEADQAKAEKGG